MFVKIQEVRGSSTTRGGSLQATVTQLSIKAMKRVETPRLQQYAAAAPATAHDAGRKTAMVRLIFVPQANSVS